MKSWKHGSKFVKLRPTHYSKKRTQPYVRIQVLRTDSQNWIKELEKIPWKFKGVRHYKIEKGFLVYQYDKYIEIMGKYYNFEPQPFIFYHIESGRFYSYRKYLNRKRNKKSLHDLEQQATFIAQQLKFIGVITYQRRG